MGIQRYGHTARSIRKRHKLKTTIGFIEGLNNGAWALDGQTMKDGAQVSGRNSGNVRSCDVGAQSL
ncbi:uncharacterized protein LOC143303314 isoform X2 [Bombus vancouverensis nearcticus]|uniref:uncharacterized protein LOC143303314 isoform X2 n=1 Tax=Bombus vancouverensis nearcticus TaxID=2705178 RepID=UPI00402B4840